MPLPSQNSEVATGQLDPSSTWGEFNNINFVVQQMLSKMETATLVRVESCTNSGGLSPVGFVDVTPLVNQIDGQGNPTPHETIYNVIYFRLQGGTSAIINDPQPGDIGACIFASRDISKVKATKKQGNPGSRRKYSFSDGMYIGGFLNGTPTQYVKFSSNGIDIHSPNTINLSAPTINLSGSVVAINGTTSTTVTTPIFTVNGTVQINGATAVNGGLSQSGGGASTFSGSMIVTGNVTAQGTSLHTHTHGGVTTGSGMTGVPT